jgi:hypothetical protein
MRIDNAEEVNISESESHVGSDNVMWAWNKLRTGKRVVVSGSGVKPATFTCWGLPQFFLRSVTTAACRLCTVVLPHSYRLRTFNEENHYSRSTLSAVIFFAGRVFTGQRQRQPEATVTIHRFGLHQKSIRL